MLNLMLDRQGDRVPRASQFDWGRSKKVKCDYGLGGGGFKGFPVH